MYEVECTIDSKYSFTTQFYVHLIPSAPVKWKILLSPDAKHGIQCASGDFSSKVLGVWLVDDAGNDAPGDYLPTISPTLCLSWTHDNTLPTRDGGGTQIQHIELILEEMNEEGTSHGNGNGMSSQKISKTRKYILPPETKLQCDCSLPAPFWLWVFDSSETYHTSFEPLTAIASYPSKLLFRCQSIFGENSLPTLQLEPIPFINISKITDLEIFFYDSQNQETSFTNHLQDCHLRIFTEISSEIINLDIETKEIILYQKKNWNNKNNQNHNQKFLNNISINFMKITEVIEQYRPMVHEELIELKVSCSYVISSTGQKIYLEPTPLLMCRYLLLNLVTQLHLSYRIISITTNTQSLMTPSTPTINDHENQMIKGVGPAGRAGAGAGGGGGGGVESALSMDSFYQQPPPLINLSMLSLENGIQCGNKSKINLCLQTEDGQLVEVQVGDIQIKISYQDPDGNERKVVSGGGGEGEGEEENMIDIETMKATFYVDYTTQTNVSYLVPALTRTGKYIFHFCYQESRPKIITNKFIPQSILKVTHPLFLPACLPAFTHSLFLL
jgi:hypothetical protein